LKGSSLLAPPVLAFLCVYVASLVVLLLSAFWTADPFTGKTVHHWTLDNFKRLLGVEQGTSGIDWTYWTIVGRTVLLAAAVTITDAILALPLGFYMARVAAPRTRAILFVMVLLPLWASYLVRIYSWTTILSADGVLNWALNGLGLPDAHIAYTNWAMWIVFSYIWLPFMVIPVFAAFERIPESYLEASRDLGARGTRTFRSVVFPLALPGIVAGSIFTFSLTLGDYITPELVGGPNSSFIGNVIDQRHGDDIPFAAALATVPLVIMAGYIAIAKRLGAFEAL
jgi:putative spermidine/putrescine transport system permease protein